MWLDGAPALDLSDVYDVVEAVHAPYCQLLVHYPMMEAQVFSQKLKMLGLVHSGCCDGVV